MGYHTFAHFMVPNVWGALCVIVPDIVPTFLEFPHRGLYLNFHRRRLAYEGTTYSL